MFDMSQAKQFIIVDDEDTSLLYCSLVIKKNFNDKEVIKFKDPCKAVEYFTNSFSADSCQTVVLLDINMPELSGWQVLDKLQMLSKDIKEKLSVLMVSSSIDTRDKTKASQYSLVRGYIEKPLTFAKLKDMMASGKVQL